MDSSGGPDPCLDTALEKAVKYGALYAERVDRIEEFFGELGKGSVKSNVKIAIPEDVTGPDYIEAYQKVFDGSISDMFDPEVELALRGEPTEEHQNTAMDIVKDRLSSKHEEFCRREKHAEAEQIYIKKAAELSNRSEDWNYEDHVDFAHGNGVLDSVVELRRGIKALLVDRQEYLSEEDEVIGKKRREINEEIYAKLGHSHPVAVSLNQSLNAVRGFAVSVPEGAEDKSI